MYDKFPGLSFDRGGRGNIPQKFLPILEYILDLKFELSSQAVLDERVILTFENDILTAVQERGLDLSVLIDFIRKDVSFFDEEHAHEVESIGMDPDVEQLQREINDALRILANVMQKHILDQ